MTPLQRRCQELLPVIQAGAEGKAIERNLCGEWEAKTNGSFADGIAYRIKPEPKYRPFTHREIAGHIGNKIRVKGDSRWFTIWGVNGNEKIELLDSCGEIVGFRYLLDFYQFTDGTPCGVLLNE